jgi:hypothetical protein
MEKQYLVQYQLSWTPPDKWYNAVGYYCPRKRRSIYVSSLEEAQDILDFVNEKPDVVKTRILVREVTEWKDVDLEV